MEMPPALHPCRFSTLIIMPLQPTIQTTNLKELSNRHGTFRHSINNLFNIANGDTGILVNDYNATTAAIQQLLGRALRENKTVRCLGSNWSWTRIGFTNDWIIHTKRLNILKRILPAEVFPSYPFVPDGLVFAQCGCTIQELSRELRVLGRALKTSGASNGQTIAGAISTGTHGSAMDFGATPDFVVGLHIIVSPEKHIYLERATRPVVSNLFAQKIGAVLLRDDEIFNAALVSFGSFGFIHGVMMETEPLYLLNAYRMRAGLDMVKTLASSLDFRGNNFLPFREERPFHFQFLINPYDTANGAYLTAMYKRPYRNDYPRIVQDFTKAGPGEDMPIFLGRITNTLPVLTHLVVNTLIKNAYAPFSDVWGTLNEIFYNTDMQGRVLSAAIGIPAEHTARLADLLLDLNKKKGPFVGVFAFRFVKKSKALLGFTKFEHTCVAEFDSVESPATRNFYEAIWQAVEAAGIPFTFHWGKINSLDAAGLRKKYGADRDRWISARQKLLSAPMQRVFTNETMVNWGLDEVGGVV